jgi:hypothetical protein
MDANRHSYAELLDQPYDCRGKPLPLHIRLRTAEQEKYLAVTVSYAMDAQMEVRIRLPLVGVEDHRRSPAAVVVELIMIEFGEYLVLKILQQICREQPSSLPSVDETIELVDQHGPMILELGYHSLVQDVQLPRVHHNAQSTWDCRPTLACVWAATV